MVHLKHAFLLLEKLRFGFIKFQNHRHLVAHPQFQFEQYLSLQNTAPENAIPSCDFPDFPPSVVGVHLLNIVTSVRIIYLVTECV